ncbi:Filamentous hemagglutinin transporter [Melia azedarach]|uniref:Filamentous hemagglutinin transporter n=1 Tax=Melia azedarach TaxID=155640 RepID=A0ACC1WWI8_MELAZ|nr:Filamentous hemagglutinin transporter [Melia azedarach]
MASHIGASASTSAQAEENEMAADVSSENLITQDLLGGLSQLQEKEKLSHERCSSPNSPLSSISSENKQNPDGDFHEDLQLNLNLNLNHSPCSSTPPKINLLCEETCLDLKLPSRSNYQSVCTLDKVKSALQRAEKLETSKKRSSPVPLPVPSSSGMFAAACPGCLLYVITLKTNPKCPRCNSIVPSPLLAKKARIDLNASSV